MESMETNIAKMDAQLKRWAVKIDDMVAKADVVEDHLRADYHKHLDNLKTQRTAAQARFEMVKGAGSQTWDAFQAGLKSVWTDAEHAFNELKADVPGPALADHHEKVKSTHQTKKQK